MDIQLQELVDKIKKDGVEAASAKAGEIQKEAEEKAAKILAGAKQEAETIRREAADAATRETKAAENAIRQTARNLLLSFREGIVAELDAVIKAGTGKAYDASVLQAALPDVVKAWAGGSGDGLSVLLPESQLAGLQAYFLSALKDRIAAGLVIAAGKDIPGGFRIAEKDGSAYYDFSAEAVADLFSAYLNPRVAELMKSAAKEL